MCGVKAGDLTELLELKLLNKLMLVLFERCQNTQSISPDQSGLDQIREDKTCRPPPPPTLDRA